VDAMRLHYSKNIKKVKELKHIQIAKNTIYIDDKLLLNYEAYCSFNIFIKNVYKQFDINYSKFYKMSNMCKLGFIASELLLMDFDLNTIDKNKVAVVLSCKSSSLNIDIEYQKSITQIPSPALFVYTLPNIVIGEICIKNGFKGEEMMFVSENFNKIFLFNYIVELFQNQELCIAGFLDYDENDNYLADMYLVKK